MARGEKPLIVNPAALDSFADAFEAMGAVVAERMGSIADAMRIYCPPPPKNLPRDPSMRKDRRKWGGK